MPTPLEILFDPVSLAVLAIHGGLVLLEAGFEGVSSAQILDMLACRDVAARDFEQSVQPATSSVAHS